MTLCAALFVVIQAWGSALSPAGPPPGFARDTVIRISVGAGMAFSTVNMGIEPIGEIKGGLNARLALRLKRRIGFTAEFTNQFPHSASPAWGSIQARNFDLNLNYLYLNVGQTNTKFYGLIGACFQQWKGIYQGTPAVGKDIYDYQSGEVVKFNWNSLNLGIGFERFYRHIGLFGEFKFRFGQNYPYDPFAIVDVCATIGTKINLISIGNGSRSGNHNKSPRHLLKPKIYHWF